MITQSKLKELFNYIDGELYWKVRPYKSHVDISNPAGCLTNHNYRVITIEGKVYRAHRLVFLMHHNNLPDIIDHINNNKSDNRIENLRPASIYQNTQNAKRNSKNTSGVKGVSFSKQAGKWRAAINANGEYISIGFFSILEDAEKAMAEKRLELHGEYANNG